MENHSNTGISAEKVRQQEAWRAVKDFALRHEARVALRNKEVDDPRSIDALLDLIEAKTAAIVEREGRNNFKVDTSLGMPGSTVTIGRELKLIDTLGVLDLNIPTRAYVLEALLVDVESEVE